MIRLFAALPVGDDAIEKLAPLHARLSQSPSILKPVEPGAYHITLKFFGNCDGPLASAVEDAFMHIRPPAAAIRYELRGLGSFPNPRAARVVWCGLRTDAKELLALVEQIEGFAERLGFERENRRFTPHLTLARVRAGRALTEPIVSYLEEHAHTGYGSSAFDRIVLFSSRLRPEGPEYTPLRTIALPPPAP